VTWGKGVSLAGENWGSYRQSVSGLFLGEWNWNLEFGNELKYYGGIRQRGRLSTGDLDWLWEIYCCGLFFGGWA